MTDPTIPRDEPARRASTEDPTADRAGPSKTEQPAHEIEDLETDPTVPPRPEEEVADAGRSDER